ncbi:DNA polymerase IV [Cellvibrio zantedeschiae]|uniref:DNA polymerase IV n=2 Tax=Cellvibrio zantedeschiae TaxID=1237077 RepID=A0ABQ3ANU9_9GAMM|nr:DNA polymerase IV [Cellvibrio zantedeschiae]
MRDDPSLRSRPIAVGGSSEQRGVISTCNYEARHFGVRSAMSSIAAKKLCPDLIILPHRMEAYREASVSMRHIFYQYTDLVEPLSLDEAYLDVSDSEYCGGSATRIAEQIRQRVYDELKLTVSAGVAPNKFLAKVASDWNKPNGLFVITPNAVDSFVLRLPVSKIFGVGKATNTRLAEINIKTCADLRRFSIFELKQRFGQLGVRLYELCRGIDNREVSPSRRRKSLSVENTFPQDLRDLASCLNRLPELLQQLASRLRRIDDDYVVVKIFVKIKFADFTQTTIERSGSTLTPSEFQSLCCDAYARKESPVRLLGVGVRFVDLREDQPFYQLDLFE